MQLKKVAIKNFRSIEYIEIDFASNYNILVGKNESGKSNILKALSLLSPKTQVTNSDLREPLPTEDSISESFVRFIFTPTETEFFEILSKIEKTIIPRDAKKKIFIHENKEYTLEEFLRNESQVLYVVDILNKTRYYSYWAFKKPYKFIEGIKTPDNYSKPNEAIKNIELTHNNYYLIDTKGTTNTNITYSEVSVKDFYEKVVSVVLKTYLEKTHPSVLYWEYDEKNLLPPSVSLDTFAANPLSCIPLKNLFNLAGIKDISSEIKKARESTSNSPRNLLNRVAEHATNHFRNVWKEYKTISFYLLPNGNNIDTGIKEINSFTFNQRSDGFKRFITFLLMLSTQNKNNSLKNSIILADEPDISIHPSGVRNLRDELINISSKNIVVASTHSIFLIDSNNLNSHYIITKEKEKTLINIPTETTICEEEVLYRALGYSIYESFKETNIIFEGWRDKELFKTAAQKPINAYKNLKELVKNFGLSHSNGVKQIKYLSPIFEIANRKVIICSDDDNIAKEKQREFKKEKLYGEWYRYSEILPSTKAVTGEDFIKSELLKNGINYLATKYSLNESDLKFEEIDTDIIKQIDKWLAKTIFDKSDRNLAVDSFKDFIFKNLTPAMIKEEYFSYCMALIKLVETKE